MYGERRLEIWMVHKPANAWLFSVLAWPLSCTGRMKSCALTWLLVNPKLSKTWASLDQCPLRSCILSWLSSVAGARKNSLLQTLHPSLPVSQEVYSKSKSHFDAAWLEIRAPLPACYLTANAKRGGIPSHRPSVDTSVFCIWVLIRVFRR